ncbi:hypothetical protein LPJ57_007335, partial [Coemansia sp. RSA 486]
MFAEGLLAEPTTWPAFAMATAAAAAAAWTTPVFWLVLGVGADSLDLGMSIAMGFEETEPGMGIPMRLPLSSESKPCSIPLADSGIIGGDVPPSRRWIVFAGSESGAGSMSERSFVAAATANA